MLDFSIEFVHNPSFTQMNNLNRQGLSGSENSLTYPANAGRSEGLKMRKYKGLAATLDSFIRNSENNYFTANPSAPRGNEYFFEVGEISNISTTAGNKANSTLNYMSIHRRTGTSAFGVTLTTKDSHDNCCANKPYMITIFSLTEDGVVKDYREDASTTPLNAKSFRVRVSPGSHISYMPSNIFPEEHIEQEVQNLGEKIIQTLIRSGTLVNVSKSISLGMLRSLD